MKAMFFFFAVFEDVFVGAVGEVVLVLDADDIDDFAGLFDFRDFDFAEADVADLALLLKVFDGTEGLFYWRLGVDAVKLPELDGVFFEDAEAQFDLLDEIFGAADGEPFVGALAGESAFGAMTTLPLGPL